MLSGSLSLKFQPPLTLSENIFHFKKHFHDLWGCIESQSGKIYSWRSLASSLFGDCHHTPIFQRINIIVATTQNNLISDMHVSAACRSKREVDVDCINTNFRGRMGDIVGGSLAVSNIFTGIYWFNWTLIDDVRNRIIKRHLFVVFLSFLLHWFMSRMLVVLRIDWGENRKTRKSMKWIVMFRKGKYLSRLEVSANWSWN